MQIPESVRGCIDALENAGFATYLVGGCVRDACLGLIPHDFDLCTSALPEQTEAVFAFHSMVSSTPVITPLFSNWEVFLALMFSGRANCEGALI